jgi:plastocyanin
MQAAIHLAPILAAEKSKTAFYIAGGVLVLWALVVSLAIGMRRPDFPSSVGAERAVMAISAVLVLAAVAAAVATSGSPAKATSVTAAQPQPTPSISSAPTPAPSGGGATAPSQGTATTAPSTATTPRTAGTSPAQTTALGLQTNPTGQLSFNTKTLSAKAGKVSITLTNASPLEHNVAVAQGASVLGSTPTFLGGARTVTLTLKPGTYTFYCTVPGHRYAGMEGTLKVS